MKRIVLIIIFGIAVSLFANAQTTVDFHEMPLAAAPLPMPDNYPSGAGLYWANFSYVTPGIWNGAGSGFWVDPATRHNTVAFFGGTQCSFAYTCHASIKLIGANATATFSPITVVASSGWVANKVTVIGYNNSTFVGQVVWNLTTTPQVFSFPSAWNVTQLVFVPEVSPAHAVPVGSMVMYNFVFM
jgi:hypothetical protein